jgi:hypothetical protein
VSSKRRRRVSPTAAETRRASDPLLRWASVVGPLALMFLLAFTPGLSFTEDLGRHLLLGRIIWEGRAVPDTNLLTYTYPDFPFINHHWLTEVFFYWLHRLAGFNGMIVWKMVVMSLALGLALAAVRPARRYSVYWLAGLLSAVILGFRAHVRPELLTYLGVALYLWSFERIRRGARWPRWVILGYALLWANSHIYFLFGVGMAGAFALERAIAGRSRVSLQAEAGWLAAVAAISCVNPQGIRGFLYPLGIFSNYSLGLVENASPLEVWASVINPMLIALPPLCALFGVAVLALWHRRGKGGVGRAANVLVGLTALVMSWLMVRSTPLFALSALPVIAAALAPAREGEGESRAGETGMRILDYRRLAWAPAPVAVLLLNLWLAHGLLEGWYTRIFPAPVGPTPLGFENEERFLRLRQLASRNGLRGPIFSDFKIGSLLEYELYPEAAYVDNRPEAFPAAFWRKEYLPALGLRKDWARIENERDFNAVIVSLVGAKEFFIQELRRRPEWVLVHLDSLAAVFVRNSAPNAGIIGELRFSPERIDAYASQIGHRIDTLDGVPWWRRQVETEWAVQEVYSLVCIGEYGKAWPHVWKLYQKYPDHQGVQELLWVSVPPSDADRVKPIFARRARWPLAVKEVVNWGGYVASTGDLAAAERILRRGRLFFPLSTILHQTLEKVEGRGVDLRQRRN